MRPEASQQLDQLFNSALERHPAERAAFLNRACADDHSLHKQVAALLAAHEDVGSFGERPALELEARLMAEDRDQLVAGQAIGHFKIISKLGEGGMGEVYLAEDVELGRKVALKLLPIDFSRDIDRVRRFQQEAHAASALNHPNIVTVYEIAHLDDRHLIATEFIDGETLRERIRGDPGERSGKRLPIGEVLNIGIQVADALAAAQEAGIVHRDIKPDNIMLRRRDGYIKVLDFGLAKLTPVGVGGHDVDAEAATRPQVKTSAGLVMGTVSYMSPEQTRGEKVDARTDIWSLGVVLYELVAGCAPFDRPTPSEVIAAILDNEPRPLRDYVGEIPSELERIIGRALTKDREQRYQTARELLLDLRHLQHCVEVEKEWSRSSEACPIHHTKLNRAYLLRAINEHKRPLIIALVALVLLVAAVIYSSYFTTGKQTIDSIAVLPLVNASNDPNTEYLSDGISEALINSLTELQHLRVIARATAFRYKGKDVDPQAVGRDLKVGAVLMGRMRQIGETLNIQVDLVDAATGAQLWGQEYEGKVSDLLSVKQAIAREVTEKLRLELSGEQQQQLSRSDTTNAEAYEFYLRGRYFWNRRTAEGLNKAIEQFLQAIDRDPDYAMAHVGLADSYALLEQYAGTPSRETLPKAKAAVERALQIDDSLAEGHATLGFIEYNSWNFSAAEKEYKRAIELSPNYATAHFYYAVYLRNAMGSIDKALAEQRLAQQFDPLSPIIGVHIASSYALKGELDRAIKEERNVIELDPNFPEAHHILGVLYRKQGRYEDAIKEFEKALELFGSRAWTLADLGMCYAVTGKRVKALAILRELTELYSRREALGQHVASLYAALGDKDQAFAWLERDFQAHSGFLVNIAHGPRNDVLRATLSSDPRWSDLLQRIGLTAN